MAYQPKVYKKHGGNEQVVASGGVVTVQSGGSIVLEAGATLDRDAATNGAPGAGISGGTGTLLKTGVERVGDIIHTVILVDLTGLDASATDLDIIGVAGEPAYLGQITAARNGTILAGKVTCLEVPAGAADDVDLYSAAEATGEFDAGIGTLTETALVTSGAAWTSGAAKGMTTVPAADEYLYLTAGEGSANGTYTAGKFLIELWGYEA